MFTKNSPKYTWLLSGCLFLISCASGKGGGSASFNSVPLTPSGPVVLNGGSGLVIQNLKITSTTGDCLTIKNATNVLIKNSEIGPCGGNGIRISNVTSINIYDSYIHPENKTPHCCDNNDGILVDSGGATNVVIQGNIVAYGEANIHMTNATHVQVLGNFLLNPRNDVSRGQNFQVWGGSSDITVSGNYALSSTDTTKYLYPAIQEDSINFGGTSGITASANFITGGLSPSGCGLIADDGADNAQFLNNELLDTGQCGIAIASGQNQLITGNRVLNRTYVTGGGNQGLYVWNQYSGVPCGPVTISGNISANVKPDGSISGYWNGGGCGTVSESGDTFWSTAYNEMSANVPQYFPTPAVPPSPHGCVANSPYTTNAGFSSCH